MTALQQLSSASISLGSIKFSTDYGQMEQFVLLSDAERIMRVVVEKVEGLERELAKKKRKTEMTRKKFKVQFCYGTDLRYEAPKLHSLSKLKL